MRKAVLGNDVKWLSEAMSYPIVLKSGESRYTLQNTNDFALHASVILTPHLKSTVQNQSPDTLFKNWQGVMVGKGEIWFSEVAENNGKETTWVQRIIAINLPETK